MPFSSKLIRERFSELVVSEFNDEGNFTNIASTTNFDTQSLIFVVDDSQIPEMDKHCPAVVITTLETAKLIPHKSIAIIAVNNVRLAHALIKQEFYDYESADPEWGMIHESAIIHPSASIGKDVRIGPNTIISKEARIGNATIIRANCVIEAGAEIGQECIIHNLVNIGKHCIIGDRVTVRPGAIIGNEGFGFAQDDQKAYHRIPQTGNVIINDDAQIGSNCNIDRATYGSTIIGKGVKIDSLCHIAHNVTIDENSLLVSQTGIAGSSKLGKRVIASGQTGILDHKTIVDDVAMVHRCGVISDILTPGVWAGLPPKPFKEHVKGFSVQKKLDKLQREIASLKKELSNE